MQCRSRIRTGDVSLNRRSKPLPHRCLAMFSDSIGFSMPPIQLLKFDLLCSFVDATASGMRRVNKRALGLLSTKTRKMAIFCLIPICWRILQMSRRLYDDVRILRAMLVRRRSSYLASVGAFLNYSGYTWSFCSLLVWAFQIVAIYHCAPLPFSFRGVNTIENTHVKSCFWHVVIY